MAQTVCEEPAEVPEEGDAAFQKLLDEWDPHFPDGEWNPFDVEQNLIYVPPEPPALRVEVSNASPFEQYDLLLREGARVAAMNRGAQLSLECKGALVGSKPDSNLLKEGLTWTEFMPEIDSHVPKNARLAVEFFSSTVMHLLPSAARGEAFLLNCRRILYSTNMYRKGFWRYLNINRDYFASFNNLNMDNLHFIRDKEGIRATGRMDLIEGLHECSMGLKLWHWLRDADVNLVVEHFESLLSSFIDTYHEFGGQCLEVLRLRELVSLSAACDFVQLIENMPQIHEWRAKSEWASVESLSDLKPPPGAPVQKDWAWKQAARLFNVAALIAYWNLDAFVKVRTIVSHLDNHLMKVREPHMFRMVEPNGADVTAEAYDASCLIAHLPYGMIIYGSPIDAKSNFIKTVWPVEGWVRAHALEYKDVLRYNEGNIFTGDGDSQRQSFVFSMCSQVRQASMGDPLGMCGTASKLLLASLHDTIALLGAFSSVGNTIEEYLQRGSLRLVDGSFLARPVLQADQTDDEMNWWPHSFLVFEGDGSILDVTADQFKGGEPQIWWPADASRYSFSIAKANESRKKRLAASGVCLERKTLQSD